MPDEELSQQFADKDHRTKTTKEKRRLRVPLTDAELIAAGQRLADEIREIQSLEADAAAVSKQYKAKIAEVQAKLDVTRGLVHDRYEIRQVEVANVLDYTDVKSRTFRLDTGEMIEERKLTEDEKQSSLPFDNETEEQTEPVEDGDVESGFTPEEEAQLAAADAKLKRKL